MEEDKVLDQLDERAQYLRRTEFMGADYVPDSNTIFEEDQLHAEIVYLDDVTNPDVIIEAAQSEGFEEVEDAIDDLSTVVETGLDSLTSTILQQKEDAAVEAASTVKNFPIALFGQPDFGSRTIDIEADNSDIVDGQNTQTTELVAIRDIMEGVYVEQRNQARNANMEDAEFSEIEDDMYKREQVMLLENMNDTLKDIERNGGGSGGGLFDSLLDMVGLGGKDKDGKGGKNGKHNDNGINRRGNKSGFLKGKAGGILQGALAAGAAMYVFDDFLWGDEQDPNDKGLVGALGSTLFGDSSSPETEQIISDTKESYKEQLVTNTNQTQIVSSDSDSDSSPFLAGATALGGAVAIGAGYKKFIGESNPMMGTKGGVSNALHLPALPSANPIQSAIAKGGAVAGEASASKGLMSRIPYLQLLLGGVNAYSTITDDELTTKEKIADVSGIGGGFAGAAAGAASMGALGTAVGTVVPGLGNIIGGGLGSVIGGGLGYVGGEKAVTSVMDWLLGNDRDKVPEEVTAEQAAQTARPETNWWEEEPTRTTDGKVIVGDRTFPNMDVYRGMKQHKESFAKAEADGTVNKTRLVNGEVVQDIDEAQVKTSQLSTEATSENSDALDKLTKAIGSAGLGLTGLGTIAGSAKTAWQWAKGVFGIGGDSEKEITAETAVTSPVPIEAQLSQQYGDAAVDQVDSATTTKAHSIKEYKTSSAIYDTAEATNKTVEKVSHTNSTLKDAVSAIRTYSETQRGYDNWLDDFGKTDVTYDQFLNYFNASTATPQFMGGSNVTASVSTSSDTTTASESSDVATNNNAVTSTETIASDKQFEAETREVNTMDGVTPSVDRSSEVNWTPTESPWHDWSKTHSDYSKFDNQGEVDANPTKDVGAYAIDQSPNTNIEVAPASTDVKHTNFVEARHTILDTATDVQNSARVDQSERKSEKASRASTRDNIKTRPANRAAGRSARPSISSVPIIVDDSGLTALNLGYL